MMKWLKESLGPFVDTWGVFRLVLTGVSLASLVGPVWLSAFPMPARLQEIARPMGLLSSVFGILFGLRWRPTRPLLVAVSFYLGGWALFGGNYLVANTMEGLSRSLVLLGDLLQIALFAGFFLSFALAFAVCVRGIGRENNKGHKTAGPDNPY